MEETTNLRTWYSTLVAALNAESGWDLSTTQQHSYVSELLKHPPKERSEARLRRQIENYHKDHNLVRSLRDHQHPQHDSAWSAWVVQTVRILQHKGLGHAYDVAISTDDLTQVALDALIGALPSYRYESRFSTWAHTVIVRSVLRYLRSANVRKSRTNVSLDQQPDGGDTLLEQLQAEEQTEVLVEERNFREVIYEALGEHPDQRLRKIFYLRAQGSRLADIGKQFRPPISASRVCVLLDQGCQFLQQHPVVQEWVNEAGFKTVNGCW